MGKEGASRLPAKPWVHRTMLRREIRKKVKVLEDIKNASALVGDETCIREKGETYRVGELKAEKINRLPYGLVGLRDSDRKGGTHIGKDKPTCGG